MYLRSYLYNIPLMASIQGNATTDLCGFYICKDNL